MPLPTFMKVLGLTMLAVYTVVIVFAELILWGHDIGPELKEPWMNVEYHLYPSEHMRHLRLLGLTLTECKLCRQLLVAGLVGGLIGAERRSADRPAGIRTMCLVSIGACNFTIASTFAFRRGPMNWDSSRISAAIPAGVGFLGAGVIWKDSQGGLNHMVRGLTSATSIWLAAACGVAVGGELYIVSIFAAGVAIVILRYAPHAYNPQERVSRRQSMASASGGDGGNGGTALKKSDSSAVKRGSRSGTTPGDVEEGIAAVLNDANGSTPLLTRSDVGNNSAASGISGRFSSLFGYTH